MLLFFFFLWRPFHHPVLVVMRISWEYCHHQGHSTGSRRWVLFTVTVSLSDFLFHLISSFFSRVYCVVWVHITPWNWLMKSGQRWQQLPRSCAPYVSFCLDVKHTSHNYIYISHPIRLNILKCKPAGVQHYAEDLKEMCQSVWQQVMICFKKKGSLWSELHQGVGKDNPQISHGLEREPPGGQRCHHSYFFSSESRHNSYESHKLFHGEQELVFFPPPLPRWA